MEYNFENIETMSYQEMTTIILEKEKKAMNTFEIFTIISKALNLTESQFEKRIEDFFATLSTNKQFTLLEDGSWDLKKNHAAKIFIDENNDETDDEYNDDNENTDEIDDNSSGIEEEANYDLATNDESIIDNDDDLEGLTTLTEEEIEDEEN